MADLVVDIHAHYVPNLVFQRFSERSGAFPGVRMTEETAADGSARYRFQFAGGAPTRPVLPALSEIEQRRRWMASEGVDHQLLSLWTDLEGYELPPAEGLAWSRFINECLLEELRNATQFTPLASLPLQDGALAAEVLSEAMQSGFAGAMIGTLPKGIDGGNLDDPALDPFWATAARLGAAIYLHPMFLCNEPRLLDYELINTVGRLADTSIAMGRLIFAGHLLKYPGLKLVLSHGGGVLPSAMGRFRRVNDAAGKRFADPLRGFDTLYFDSCVYDPATLEFLVARTSPQRVMLGTDSPMPIAEEHPVRLIEATRLPPADRRAILGGNARRVFRLRSDHLCCSGDCTGENQASGAADGR